MKEFDCTYVKYCHVTGLLGPGPCDDCFRLQLMISAQPTLAQIMLAELLQERYATPEKS